uniref:Binding-protein-dependent transport system inner membrane component n=1 Tax=Candidatus Kentrum sp. LPFa TaxID=2126335 RepID=A0A450WTC1_9GAMM|nr:MAG: Binding-protein-dependent transport system inner membrane component [Candidatus Kentron sp. LPFa]VFK34292.1 MAG: Binding-protein-dependent transport system inner membrane component [Candidatus Kentron sp. LPFa]
MPWKDYENVLFFAGLIPRIFAFQFLLSGNGPLSSVWSFIGAEDGAVLYTPLGILLGYLTVYVPLCLMILYAARRAVPQDHILAAKDLGASWRRIQYSIVIPAMKPGIIVALILPFIVSLGDVIVPDLIGGSQVYTATAMILDFVKIDDWGSAAAVGVFLLFVTITAISVASAVILRSRY